MKAKFVLSEVWLGKDLWRWRVCTRLPVCVHEHSGLCVHTHAELQRRPVPETAAFLLTPKPALFPKCFLIIRRHIFPHHTWLLFLYSYTLAAVQTLLLCNATVKTPAFY